MHHDNKEFIRIFKDEVSKDLWESYCSACRITDPNAVKSFRVYYDPQKDIEIDEYNLDGSLKQ